MPTAYRVRIAGFGLLLMLFSPKAMWAQDISSQDTPSTLSPVTVTVLKGTLSKTDTVSLTLQEALEMVQTDNLGLKIAQSRVNEARARYQTRLAEMLPDLEVTYSDTNYEGAIQGFGNDIFEVDRRTFLPQMIFRFPIFQGGRRLFQAQSAKRLAEAQEATSETTHQQTLRQTALYYYDLKRRLDEIAIAQKQLEESQAQLDLNQARLEAGVGTRLDVLQSEAQVARSQQLVLESVRTSEVAALRLNELLDLPAFSTMVPKEQGQQMQTLVSENATLEGLLEMAYRHRPELASFQKQIEAMIALRRVVWSAVLPEVNLQVRTGAVGPQFDSIEHFDENSYSVGLVFRNLLATALTRYKENTAQLEALKYQFEQTENLIQREISEALLQAATKRAQVATVRAELAASELALSDALERLRVGVGRNIDVLDAETSVTRARTNLSTTILEYNQAQVDLVYALGLASVESLTQGIQWP